MPKRILALEWESREARVVQANVGEGRVVVEGAWAIPLPESKEGTVVTAAERGKAIAAGLAAARVGRGDVLVAISRGSAECKQLELPPVPDEELPDIVRFQAVREIHNLADDWPLDFVTLRSTPDHRYVLAAALEPATYRDTQELLATTGLKLARLGVRPFAAASALVPAQAPDDEAPRLCVEFLLDQTDLTLVAARQVCSSRASRLTGKTVLGSADAARPLVSEIRRTIAAAAQQIDGGKVARIVVSGATAAHEQLAKVLAAELDLPVDCLDPFAAPGVELAPRFTPPAESDRFASLVGMLRAESFGVPAGIDFLHPRKRPEPPSQKRSYSLAGVAAGLLVLVGAWSVYSGLSALDQEIADKEAEFKNLEPLSKKAAELVGRQGEIEKWTGAEVVWLDEIRQLSKAWPDAREVMLSQWTMALSKGAGQMQIEGYTKESRHVAPLVQGLSDERHQVRVLGGQEVTDKKPYSWRFKAEVAVAPTPLSEREVVSPTKLPPSVAADDKAAAKPDESQPTPDATSAATKGA